MLFSNLASRNLARTIRRPMRLAVLDGEIAAPTAAPLQNHKTPVQRPLCNISRLIPGDAVEPVSFGNGYFGLCYVSDGWATWPYPAARTTGAGGLYSRGRLIHGQSIQGDISGHEGEGLREMLEKYVRSLEEDAEL
jgi:hypothetical protein